jgi:uncharacterized membrane protein
VPEPDQGHCETSAEGRAKHFLLPESEVCWIRRFFLAEAIVFAFIPMFAAAMTRMPSL